MATIRSILQLQTSPFGSKSIGYRPSIVVLWSWVSDKQFLRYRLKRDIPPTASPLLCMKIIFGNSRGDVVGKISHFWRYLKICLSETQGHKTTIEGLYPIESEPKGKVCSFKIDCVAAVCISKFRRAWQAYFFSFTFQILGINLTF